ncbi:MAG TPA: hypothetical protein VHZ50_12295 [Puia sp.]|jgi:hypothetical protein|nr:hypothetical protein [Puia sp.]
MQYEKYNDVATSSDKSEFQFQSEGPNGIIEMVVQFTQTNNPDIFNLAFGALKKDGAIDDVTTNNNKDRNKILATIAATVYEFTATYPDKTVFFCGSTPERTRLYRDTYERVTFRKEVDYFAFMIKRKKFKFAL